MCKISNLEVETSERDYTVAVAIGISNSSSNTGSGNTELSYGVNGRLYEDLIHNQLVGMQCLFLF